MPRTPRAREESGIHHVVVQGLDHQKIFEENEDKDLYLDIVPVSYTHLKILFCLGSSAQVL